MMGSSFTALQSLVSAALCGEFDGRGLDDDLLDRIREANVDEWVEQLEYTGLFTDLELAFLRSEWQAHPEQLVTALLDGAYESALLGDRSARHHAA
ncbi:hypothetical protein G4X40_21310 [Rhodococcus sp. D2-41]|nr:hypothetical protein [Rhodococcus sp. D2-41]MDG3012682.1 hypothetical protein [Rhodococcus sp. D2-41]